MADNERTFRQKLRQYLAPTLLISVVVGILFLFRHNLVPFILALIIVYLMEPAVKRLNRLSVGKRKLPRWVAVIIVYLLFFGALTTTGRVIIPPLAAEFAKLASDAPRFFDELREETIPEVNRDIQTLLTRWFPPRMEEHHVLRASEHIHQAQQRADVFSSLLGLMTPEEREIHQLGGLEIVVVGPPTTEEVPPALRIRPDPETGEYLVFLDELELISHPEVEGGYIVRPGFRPEEQTVGIDFDLEESLNESLEHVVELSGQGVAKLVSIGQGLAVGLLQAFIGIILTFMVAAFISIDLPGIMKYIKGTFPKKAWGTYDDVLHKLDRGLAGVVRGQLLICVVNGTLTAVGLLLFDVKFALILALFATVLSLIPIFGTIISTIPCVAVGLTQGVSVALLVLGWILMIHFIEANILNPKIIGTSAHIHPAIVVFALLAGEHSYGIVGALLAVPVASIFLTLLRFILDRLRSTSDSEQQEAT